MALKFRAHFVKVSVAAAQEWWSGEGRCRNTRCKIKQIDNVGEKSFIY